MDMKCEKKYSNRRERLPRFCDPADIRWYQLRNPQVMIDEELTMNVRPWWMNFETNATRVNATGPARNYPTTYDSAFVYLEQCPRYLDFFQDVEPRSILHDSCDIDGNVFFLIHTAPDRDVLGWEGQEFGVCVVPVCGVKRAGWEENRSSPSILILR
jgi:hypothetical protein